MVATITPPPQGSLVASTDAGPIEYAERAAGVPILSIHGAGGGFDRGLALASELVDEDYRIIAPSRFGYLRTPVPPEGLAEFGHSIEEFEQPV
jgi:pimeloyl-ACP methyl ester carboxylesterase